MSVNFSGRYLGSLKCELVHDESQAKIVTDAPKDNMGDGSSFSPTDMCAASLAACIVTTMGIVAQRNGYDMTGTKFTSSKEMEQSPRRIGRIKVDIDLPASLSAEARQKIERAGETCPVHKSLHPEVKLEIKYNYV